MIKWHGSGASLAAIILAVCTLYCVYKGLELGVTSEEGLHYSIPGMRGDPHTSELEVREQQAAFQAMQRTGNRWLTVAATCFGGVLLFGWLGYQVRRRSVHGSA